MIASTMNLSLSSVKFTKICYGKDVHCNIMCPEPKPNTVFLRFLGK
jgi:hypothetical protein